MKILIAGGVDEADAAQEQRVRAFSEALGRAVIEHRHVLLNGCQTQLDGFVAHAAYQKLEEMGEPEPDNWVISYVLAGIEPSHDLGTIIKSRLADWESPRRRSISLSRSSRRT